MGSMSKAGRPTLSEYTRFSVRHVRWSFLIQEVLPHEYVIVARVVGRRLRVAPHICLGIV